MNFADGTFTFHVATVDPPGGPLQTIVFRVRDDNTPEQRLWQMLPPHSRILGEIRHAMDDEIQLWLSQNPNLPPL